MWVSLVLNTLAIILNTVSIKYVHFLGGGSKMDTCLCMTESLPCSPETITSQQH